VISSRGRFFDGISVGIGDATGDATGDVCKCGE
jgi:hypothetical protein